MDEMTCEYLLKCHQKQRLKERENPTSGSNRGSEQLLRKTHNSGGDNSGGDGAGFDRGAERYPDTEILDLDDLDAVDTDTGLNNSVDKYTFAESDNGNNLVRETGKNRGDSRGRPNSRTRSNPAAAAAAAMNRVTAPEDEVPYRTSLPFFV